ncbi:MAG: hypothetical protein ISS35_06260 [Kiritimatiellae bacterium]|nr:hypothetical protein [Kiritimatiellia bacterium]
MNILFSFEWCQELFGERVEFFFSDFFESPIVRQQAVYLIFHIGDLCVDSAGDTFLSHDIKFVDSNFEAFLKSGGGFNGSAVPVILLVFGIPAVFGRRLKYVCMGVFQG